MAEIFNYFVFRYLWLWRLCAYLLFGAIAFNIVTFFYHNHSLNILKQKNLFTNPFPNIISIIYLFQVFRIKPPMCICKSDVKFAVDVFSRAISEFLAKK